ncbi:chromosome partitioning protein, ParB family [Gemmobacter megaterium]|uniref:Chromosome partitioning protein, ParB family n=1 Tax=Gemmobacter megaterium TaxID=1086013 RepID=A0A1N7N0P1_9RHOB|nr:ParB/RepB/Spo0J family partition protein [Gemmobacter megaterium]GGE12236.1 chromosome partitioning protein ParB [Gemmobacter megaterium]SIS91848.1 chromosome partitioning protein, ParB family [Gemmobacter megaterium]
MAKRRNLEVPSSDDLQRMEEEFRRETSGPRSAVAPIAQIAAETAAAHDPRPAEIRAEAARDKAEALAFRDAQGRGLVMQELPLDEIEADALVRDRLIIDAAELEELQAAIARNGLRLPIEVFARPGQARPWGLLSGYRRLMAVRALRDLNRDGRYDRIKAVIRTPEAMGGAFAAMIEENEIRAALSQYERGRIAVIAAQQGAFANAEAAVEALFPVASKAKRSKIRSFALIFEELGDMLKFPDLIREKDGLRLAQALRDGAEADLREALAQQDPKSAEDEAALIAEVLDQLANPAPDPRKGGRPKRAPGPRAVATSGFVIESQEDSRGWSIRLGGPRRADRELVETLVRELQRLLDRPD